MFVLTQLVCGRSKALGSEKDEGLGCGLCYEQRGEVEQGLYWVCYELILILPLEVLP
jgi:hypothetical protein